MCAATDQLPIRVLIVDDDPGDARLVALCLRNVDGSEYEYQFASNLDTAIVAMRASSFDLVMLDLGMGGSEGIETLLKLRQHNDRLPVVVLSELDNHAIAVEALEHNAQDYLYKHEVNPRALSRSIRYAIRRQACVLENRRLLAQVQENEEVLRNKNARLRQLYETAHAFVDNVSHEFRTPLTARRSH